MSYLLTKDTTHAYVSDILRKGGGGTEKGGGEWGKRGNLIFFLSSKVTLIRQDPKNRQNRSINEDRTPLPRSNGTSPPSPLCKRGDNYFSFLLLNLIYLDKLRETDLLYERAILYGRMAQYDRVNLFFNIGFNTKYIPLGYFQNTITLVK